MKNSTIVIIGVVELLILFMCIWVVFSSENNVGDSSTMLVDVVQSKSANVAGNSEQAKNSPVEKTENASAATLDKTSPSSR